MKICLEIEIDENDYKDLFSYDNYKEDVKKLLKHLLFEVCENWVLNGDEPILEFTSEVLK